jgi:hypothetical protein
MLKVDKIYKNKKVLKCLNLLTLRTFFILPAMGLEPIRGCPQQILSLPRLPFRHAGLRVFFSATKIIVSQVFENGKQKVHRLFLFYPI